MATYTPNIGLHQWVAEDKFLRSDFNEDFQKIDTAVGNKADQSDLDSLRSTVSGKASSSSVNSSITNLQNQINNKANISTVNSSITNLQSQINSLDSGKAEFVQGTYSGQGSGTQTITLGFQPRALFVYGGNYLGMADPNNFYTMLNVTATGFTARWSAITVLNPNEKNTNYSYLALR